MLNEPPQEPRRRRHPLEEMPDSPPPPPPGDPQEPREPRATRQPVMLRIPTVTPYATYTILAINIFVFVLRALSPELDQQIFLWGANYAPDVLGEGELYRLFTSMFLHAGIHAGRGTFALGNSLHLILNAYIIYLAGSAVERLFGHVRFLIVYLLGGLAGSVLSVALGAGAYSVGASGAAFAILGAEFVYLWQHRKLLGERGRAQRRGLINLAVINLLFGLLTSVSAGPIRVDNWAHIGGAIGGLALAWLIGPVYIVRRHPEAPNDLIGEDINPLRARYGLLTLYGIALMVILIIARQMHAV